MNTRLSPYIGPRSFHRGEPIYGRKKEIRDLLNLLIAERIVLLYSPSGAGKTSLIQAGLIPELERKGFFVLPSIRVNLAPPEGLQTNRYVYSVLSSLEEARPVAEQLPPERLALRTIDAYLATHTPANADKVLIFDQFEEVLTANPTDIDAKHAFFSQLSAALERRRIWALVSLREDYVGALDPYVGAIPNRFHERYRLGLLSVAAAHQAIIEPVRTVGVSFDVALAQRLIDDLRIVQVQRPDGTTADELGPVVEPVQMQVVCMRLWQSLKSDDTDITAADIDALGDVNSALAEYYAAGVAAAVATPELGVRERALRDWFDTRLITERGIRTQVMQEPGASQGLDNRVIQRMIDAHLVRAESRRGMIWFELTHDRLIRPIRRNNATWRDTHLAQLQIQSPLWERQGQPNSLLLRGPELASAEAWAIENPEELVASDVALLEASRAERNRQEHEARTQQRIRLLAIVASIVGVLALALAVVSFSFYRIAEHQKRAALNQALVADAKTLLAVGDTDTALALALAGASVAEPDPEADLALALAADAPGTRWVIQASDKTLNDVLITHDGGTIISAGTDGVIGIWDVVSGRELGRLSGHTDRVDMIALSPDGRLLLSASADRSVRLWDLAARSEIERIPTSSGVMSVAFSPDGRLIAYGGNQIGVYVRALTGGPDLQVIEGAATAVFAGTDEIVVGGSNGLIRRISISSGLELTRYVGHVRAIRNLAVSPDGTQLVSGGADASVRLWDLQSGTQRWRFIGHTASVWSVTFSADGETILSSSSDGSIRLWSIASGDAARVFLGHSSAVNAVNFSPDERVIVSASEDGSLRLWDVPNRQEWTSPMMFAGATYSLAFSPDGKSTFVAASDRAVHQIDIADGSELRSFGSHGATIFAVAVSPDGRLLASGTDDPEHVIRIWDIAEARLLYEIDDHTAAVQSLAFSPDGTLLYSGSDDKTIRVWRVADGQEARAPLLGHTDVLAKILLSPDGRTLYSGGDDNIIRIWDTTDGRQTAALAGHSGGILDLAISPDGQMLASAANDRSIRLWRLSDGSEQKRITGHQGAVWSVAFSPDGITLASASTDRTVRLWRVADGEEIRRYSGHLARIWDAIFSADGRTLLSSSDDASLRVWRVETRDEIVAWAQANRHVVTLECAQRSRYQIGPPCR